MTGMQCARVDDEIAYTLTGRGHVVPAITDMLDPGSPHAIRYVSFQPNG